MRRLTIWFTGTNFSDKPATSVFRVGNKMKDEAVSGLSLPLYYFKSHCDRTSPACLHMFLHVLNQLELKTAILSDTSSNTNGSVCIMCHNCEV
jgi:hypothetical protein